MLKLASSYRLNSYVSLSLLNARFCYLTGSGSLWNVAIDEVKCFSKWKPVGKSLTRQAQIFSHSPARGLHCLYRFFRLRSNSEEINQSIETVERLVRSSISLKRRNLFTKISG
ncbi:hypothetical protein ISN45_At02g041210 [Arabidopsis thaliana x Arabidopsis arenosa]|uniref:Uncharacterized protein n=1 Tax=Arabidopsis thaliana x Arabidopsis arenosa TaxID=1240361 RepID=A0A8T2FVU1_9BRAS|nr:hypothetical protein ISN45_At02g041210 [Arabidopsis thaliana x Arabidopsis arenosa]